MALLTRFASGHSSHCIRWLWASIVAHDSFKSVLRRGHLSDGSDGADAKCISKYRGKGLGPPACYGTLRDMNQGTQAEDVVVAGEGLSV